MHDRLQDRSEVSPAASVREEAERPARLAVLALLAVLAAAGGRAQTPFPSLIDVQELDGDDGYVVLPDANPDEDLDGDFGAAVAMIGDINADGFGDYALAGGFTRGMLEFPGTVYVVFGRPNLGADGVLDLTDLDGTDGFIVTNACGRCDPIEVTAVGDFNDDGLDDFAVGAPYRGSDGGGPAGRVFLFYGNPAIGGDGRIDAQLDFDADVGLDILGVGGDAAGQVADIGDVNGDGIDDLVIGADRVDGNTGEAYIIFGGPDVGGDNGRFRLDLQLSPLTGLRLFDGEGRLGQSVAGPGDVNADGYADVLLGSDPVAYLLFGGPGLAAEGPIDMDRLRRDQGIKFEAEGNFVLGDVVERIGDINADGIVDLAVSGFPGADVAYVVFGSPDLGESRTFELGQLDGTNGFLVRNLNGSSVSIGGTAGDLNHDGRDDLLVRSNAAYVFFGSSSLGAGGELDISTVDGINGFAVDDLRDGFALDRGDGAQDVNDDGIDDLVFGDAREFDGGFGYIVFGRDAGSDRDGDGVLDFADNCQDDPNADQRDSNGDGYGNACDADLDQNCIVNALDWIAMRDVLFTNDADADLNGDGIVDQADALALFSDRLMPPGPSGLTDECD